MAKRNDASFTADVTAHGAGMVSSADLLECGIEASLRLAGDAERSDATGDCRSDDQISAVVAQVDAVPDGPVRLVGHSIGGWLLAPVASARPDRIVEIVFLAASALTRDECGHRCDSGRPASGLLRGGSELTGQVTDHHL